MAKDLAAEIQRTYDQIKEEKPAEEKPEESKEDDPRRIYEEGFVG